MRIVAAIAVLLAIGGCTAPAPPRLPDASPPTAPAVEPRPVHSGILTTPEIVSIAQVAARTADDARGSDPSLAYVGRTVLFSVDPTDLKSSYDAQARRLTVVAAAAADGFTLGRSLTHSTSLGQDIFRGQASEEKVVGDTWGVVPNGGAAGRVTLTFTRELAPDAAQALGAAIRLRVTGIIRPATGPYAARGGILEERPIFIAATPSSPIEISVTAHNVSIDITRIEWIDSRTHLLIAAKTFP